MDAVTKDLDVDAIIAVDVTAVAGVAMAFLLSEMVPAAVFSGSLFFCVPAETTASDATTDAETAIPAGSSLSSCFFVADAAIAADANSICNVKRRQRQPLCLFFYSKWNPPLLKSPAGQNPAWLERQMSPKVPTQAENPAGRILFYQLCLERSGSFSSSTACLFSSSFSLFFRITHSRSIS